MAATKTSKNKKKLTRKKAAKKPSPKELPIVAELRQQLADAVQQRTGAQADTVRLIEELQDYKRQLTEAVEQQRATSDILRVIAGSANGYSAGTQCARLIAQHGYAMHQDAVIYRLNGDVLERVAIRGSIPIRPEPLESQVVMSRRCGCVRHGTFMMPRRQLKPSFQHR